MSLAVTDALNLLREQLSVQATRQGIAQAAEWLAGVGKRLDIRDEMFYRLDVCLEETLANIVCHARHDLEVPIDLEVTVHRDEALLVVTNRGIAFDPNKYCDAGEAADLDGASVGGRGIRLIRALAEKVDYVWQDGHNRLTLHFRSRSL